MGRATKRHASGITFRRVDLDAAPEDRAMRSMLRHGTELEPDPRFARRLRGIVLSRHVAVREGYVAAPGASMTAIGRGVLVSSVLLAMSAGTVGAFSQGSLPDDLLYPIKLQLESLRMALAPEDLRDDLLAMALDERASELTRAATAGRWAAAEEAAWRVAVTEEQLIAIDGLTPATAARVQAHLQALEQVLSHAPPAASATVAERLDPARSRLERPGKGNPAPPGATDGSRGEGEGAHGSASPAGGGGPVDGRSSSPASSSSAPAQPVPTPRPAAPERPARPTPGSPTDGDAPHS